MQLMDIIFHFIPFLSGDLKDEDKVLSWFVDQLTKDEIEDVTEKMLLNLVQTEPAIAVLFCKFSHFINLR